MHLCFLFQSQILLSIMNYGHFLPPTPMYYHYLLYHFPLLIPPAKYDSYIIYFFILLIALTNILKYLSSILATLQDILTPPNMR